MSDLSDRIKALNVPCYIKGPSSCQIAARIAQLLDEAEIPNVLWIGLAQHCHGVTGASLPDFVIPDHLIQPAYEKLLASGFFLCEEGEKCIQHKYPRLFLKSDRHVHTIAGEPRSVVHLYKKSGLLWRLPDFEMGPPAADDRHLMLSNDERLPPGQAVFGGSGPWPPSLYPVKIPTAACIIETYILLSCRDWDSDQNGYFSSWQMSLFRILVEVQDKYFNDEDLLPDFRPYWQTPAPGRNHKFFELRKKLMESNELPPSPSWKSSN
ncbi:hypothetical protein PVAR5_8961 [Paecilomyces variotii No. 5]|uniref:Uncharacterized protein n=1 Tax=Byssochlamys spectabilis (strain No. 5 / NBRC 109023) TaxID=1356009 RepID=V5GGZ4_BYSSN|nr:hypothetical protein PVAR5_8961 [Paecilomyces variotii No. 5]